LLATLISWLLGVCAVFSFNIWADVHPLGFLPYFSKKTFFDLFDYFAANILLPVGGLCITLFAGWIVHAETTSGELGAARESSGFMLWRFLIRYIAPLAVVTVFIMSVAG
jgi:NSS family neurotransmitter:Na+ symporter